MNIKHPLVSCQVYLFNYGTGPLLPEKVYWGIGVFFFQGDWHPISQHRVLLRLLWALNAVCPALSPTKSPLLSICKQLSSACIICEQAMPAPHCALPCSQPSAPAAQGSGCCCCYCYYALSLPALLLAGLAAHLQHREECLLVLIGGHGWTVTFGEHCVSFTLHQVPTVMADVQGST